MMARGSQSADRQALPCPDSNEYHPGTFGDYQLRGCRVYPLRCPCDDGDLAVEILPEEINW